MPAPAELWTHDPFAADIADGYVYGRGAVDMKDLVAMELGVMRLLAGEARAAGRDPATDPIPGLRRDVLFASTADEETGGRAGAGWVVDNRPEWFQADAAINECGGVSAELGGVRFYPIGVAEKGFIDYRFTVRWHVGPRLDAARRQRGRAGRPDRRPDRRPGRGPDDPGDGRGSSPPCARRRRRCPRRSTA